MLLLGLSPSLTRSSPAAKSLVRSIIVSRAARSVSDNSPCHSNFLISGLVTSCPIEGWNTSHGKLLRLQDHLIAKAACDEAPDSTPSGARRRCLLAGAFGCASSTGCQTGQEMRHV